MRTTRSRKSATFPIIATLGAAWTLPVHADSVAPSIELAEVVVTATKREESAQNVGISLTALTSAQLEDKGVQQFFDYGTSIPNLSFGIGAADGSLAARGVALRGIQGSNTTGFYLDDTPVLETLDPHIVDIARIEVLRGPQGTLYGAESMGGTVRIVTEQPNLQRLEGQVHAGLSDTRNGSLNELTEGVVNVPLVADLAAVRASAFYQFDDGYFNKGLGPESAPPTSTLNDQGSMKYYGGQVAVLIAPASGWSITPRILYQQTEQGGSPYAYRSEYNLQQREVFDLSPGGTDKWYLASLTVNYKASYGTFVSSTAYFDRKTFETEDDTDVTQYDLSLASPLPSPITRALDLRRFAQELRFASAFSGPVQLVAGGFYSNSTRDRDYEWSAQGLAASGVAPTDLLLTFIDSRGAEEYALFGDLSYDVTPRLKATAGVRWFRDTATFRQLTNGFFFGGAPATYVAPSTSENGVTPKYLVEYKTTDNVLLYASAGKGFREGGNNIALPAGPPPQGCDQDLANIGLTAAQVSTFKSDSLWDYEAGFKSSFGERRYTLNGTAFLIDWTDIQQQVSLPLCGYGLTGNSGRARSTGIELEFSGRILTALTAGVSFGYDNAHITEQGSGSPQTVGSPVYQVPRVTLATNAEYQQPLSGGWVGFARVDYSYVGASFSANNSQVTLLRRSPYGIGNVRFGARTDRYEVAAFVKNVGDKRANLGDAIMIGAGEPGQPRFVINQPFTAGVEGRWRF